MPAVPVKTTSVKPYCDMKHIHADLLQLTTPQAIADAVLSGCGVEQFDDESDSDVSDFEEQHSHEGPAFVSIRARGMRITSRWYFLKSWRQSIVTAIEEAAELHGADWQKKISTIEISLTHSYRVVSSMATMPNNIERGMTGISFSYKDKNLSFAPVELVTRNLSYKRAIDLFMAHCGEQRSAAEQFGLMRVQRFEAHQAMVLLGGKPRVAPMVRGAQVVEPSDVNKATAEKMALAMTEWLVSNTERNGRLMYKYWPSIGREASSNNMIRQFSATHALFKAAKFYDNDDLLKTAQANLRYNIKQYFREDGDMGYIVEGQKIKLGAAALAALAVMQDPDQHHHDAELRLEKFIFRMWHQEGQFRTFYAPEDRNDSQNYYPGQALLFWANRYAKTSEDVFKDRIMTSYSHYSDWHRNSRNPAFVPWHTQAYFLLWQKTRNNDLKEFIYEMNDWLLPFQQWDDAPSADTLGRFFDPERSYGPPHSATTAQYLEGLADAYRLADAEGDAERKERYGIAIRRGLRSLLQLQFITDLDMYYINQRNKVEGALRTTVYDNTIRVDSVSHSLIALLKIFNSSLFSSSKAEPLLEPEHEPHIADDYDEGEW